MMKKQILLFAISLLLPAMPMHAAEKVLILTGGQSNTDGRLYAETLPAYLQSANTNCLASVHQPYTESRLGQFVAYYPTSGTSGQPARWAYDAVTYYYIGQALNEPFYVAKTSYGGTSIDPSVNNSPSTPTYPFLSAYGNGYHWIEGAPHGVRATFARGLRQLSVQLRHFRQPLFLSANYTTTRD